MCSLSTIETNTFVDIFTGVSYNLVILWKYSSSKNATFKLVWTILPERNLLATSYRYNRRIKTNP